MRKFKSRRRVHGSNHKFTKKRFEKYIALAISYEDWDWFRKPVVIKWFKFFDLNNTWKNRGL